MSVKKYGSNSDGNTMSDMTFIEFKENIKFTAEEEREYDKQKKTNYFKEKMFRHLKYNSFGLSILFFGLIPYIPLYIILLTSLVFFVLGIIFYRKNNFYKDMVSINNMSYEEHYEIINKI